MNQLEISALQGTIANLANGVVRQTAFQAFDFAAANGYNDQMLSDLRNILSLSASLTGKTAIFYSGTYVDGRDNIFYAKDVRDVQLHGQGYLVQDTPAQAYVDLRSNGAEIFCRSRDTLLICQQMNESEAEKVICVGGTRSRLLPFCASSCKVTSSGRPARRRQAGTRKARWRIMSPKNCVARQPTSP
jgi:hypothetical protein